jgi:hypothetical protein
VSRGISPAAERATATPTRKEVVRRRSEGSCLEWKGGGGQEATRTVERERGRREEEI